jgi:hypothetical protein
LRMLMAAFEEEEKDLVARAALRKFFAWGGITDAQIL